MEADQQPGQRKTLSAGHQRSALVPVAEIEKSIFLLRGQRVMLDVHLAQLYGVETKNLNKAVKRNLERFPADFMFQLTLKEVENLRFQFGTSSLGHGGRRYAPYVFTEQGVAMLERKIENHDESISTLFEAMRQLMTPSEKPEKEIGFHVKEDVVPYRTRRRTVRA